MHPLDRPGQAEAYEKIQSSTKKWIIIEAPTGSGKTAWAAQSGHDQYKTLALVRTKSLQEQYLKSYQFKVLKGRVNYDCLFNDMDSSDLCRIIPTDMVEACTNFDKDKQECLEDECEWDGKGCLLGVEKRNQCLSGCPYPIAKRAFISSYFGSLNYTKYLLDIMLTDSFSPQTIFLDEAHELSNLVTDWSGIEFNWYNKRGNPAYVLKYIDRPSNIMPEYGQELAWAMGVNWLEELRDNLKKLQPAKPNQHSRQDEIREYKRWKELYLKVDNTLFLIQLGKELWYIKSNDDGFLAKPLTARFHFPTLFDKADKIVLMSATIGQFATFAQELGIGDYEAIQVPNSWPAPLRPIEDLGGPEYTYKMDENDRRLHASLIANRIAQCPDWWSGIVHVTSKSMANELGERLRRLLNRPIMIPFEGWTTEEHLEKWNDFCAVEKGAILVNWAMFEGCDMGHNQISIVARCPYPDFKSSYEKARFEFDRRASLQRIANSIVQAWGRVRRGRDEDYGPNKLVAICDAKWKRLRNYISKDILESIG